MELSEAVAKKVLKAAEPFLQRACAEARAALAKVSQ